MAEEKRKRDPLFDIAEEFTDAALDLASTLSKAVQERKKKDREEAELDTIAENEMAEEALHELEREAERGDHGRAMGAYRRFRTLQEALASRGDLPPEIRERLREREKEAVRALIRLRERMRQRGAEPRTRRIRDRERRR